MGFFRELLHEILYSTSINLSLLEVVFLAIVAGLVWLPGRKKPKIFLYYSIFLIIYITLLRRAPGYDENIHWNLRIWPNAGIWAGNLLNLFLYMPMGYFLLKCKKKLSWWKIFFAAACLSIFCETLQYYTGRGWADVNDVVFNVMGAGVGAWIKKWISSSEND